jgi:lysine-ketoglutarate reductase/saccharopine dehydrogenase-like protein (TIGR00300 family)
VFPEGFHATTNLDTALYLGGHWVSVRHPEMDSGILVSPTRRSARTVKMADVRKGDAIVVGTDGVRVVPIESRRQSADFQFMTSEVSTEKPKGLLIAHVARLMKAERAAGRPILWVCGPAVVHSGAGPLFEKLIAAGYVQVLFAGNALAAHDIEWGLMGTSLGVSMREGAPTRTGHENHLRAINTIRRVGSIRRAVRTGLLKRGIMAACVKHGVDVVLAGSIRDDGPLPEVIRDTAEAQRAMRRRCRKVRLALLVATLLHSVATGNMLPASTRVVCVDIQQAAVTKLLDRGSFQTTGIVTDVQPFLRELLLELGIE